MFRDVGDTCMDFIETTTLGRNLFHLARWGIIGLGVLVTGKVVAGQFLSLTLADLLFIGIAILVFMIVAWHWEIGIAMIPASTCFIFDAGIVPTLSLYHFVPEMRWLEPFRLLLGQGIILFMIGLAFVLGKVSTTRERLTTPLTAGVLMFTLVILVSSVYGVVFNDVHLPHMVEAARPFSFYLMFFVTLLCVRSRKGLRILLTVIAFMSIVVGVGMALQFFTGDRVRIFIGHFRLESFGGRFAGRVLPPGQSLVWLAIPMLVAAAAIVRNRLRPWLFVAIIASAIGLLLTFTRAMWVGTLAGIILMMVLGRSAERTGLRKIFLAFASAIALVLLLLGMLTTDSEDYVGAYISRFTSLFYGDTYADESTFGARVSEINLAWEKVVEHPWLGIGTGAYYTYSLEWDQPTFSHVWKGVSYIHNVYMLILCKAGVIGLAAFLLMCITFFVRAIRIHRKIPDPMDAAVVLGAIGSTFSCMVGSLMQPSMAHEGPVTLLGIAWGATEYLRWDAERRGPLRARSPVRA
jgi:O-antigen ligase